MIEIGTDINREWTMENGDLELVTEDENITQAIYNRLSCYQPLLEVYYENYGGFLRSYFGRKKNSETLGLIRIELETILDQEPRIEDYSLDLSVGDAGNVIISLSLLYSDLEDTVDLNLVLDNSGLELITDDEEE